MKILRHALSITLTLLILLFPFSISVMAHPGRTDGAGGHTESSTGEYHYHHGYSAHDHYDIDGDGVIDCPYDFQDISRGSSRDDSSYVSSNTSQNSDTPSYSPTISYPSVIEEENEEEAEVPLWVYFLMAAQAILIICLYFFNIWKKDEIEDLKSEMVALRESHEKELRDRFSAMKDLKALRDSILWAQKEQSRIHSQILSERKELLQTQKLRSRIKAAPLDVGFAEDGMPIYWKPNLYKPYGDYTVYLNRKSGIYHTDRLCASYQASEDHIFNVIDKARPCKKCAEGFFDFSTVPDWYLSTETSDQLSIFDDPSIKVNWRKQQF